MALKLNFRYVSMLSEYCCFEEFLSFMGHYFFFMSESNLY